MSVASGKKIRVRKTVNMSNEDIKNEDEILQWKPRPSRKNFKAALDKKSAFAKPESVAIPMHVAEKDSEIVSQDEEFSENSVEAMTLAIKTVKETARSIAPEQDIIKLKSSEPIHPIFHANTVEASVAPDKHLLSSNRGDLEITVEDGVPGMFRIQIY